METKLFELRDKATFIPIIAIKMRSNESQEKWLLRRAGYGEDFDLFLVTALNGYSQARYDKFEWQNRTWTYAHDHIEKNWNSLNSGDVIDVEYLLNETKEPKTSERYENTL